jgi:hypothetical protein
MGPVAGTDFSRRVRGIGHSGGNWRWRRRRGILAEYITADGTLRILSAIPPHRLSLGIDYVCSWPSTVNSGSTRRSNITIKACPNLPLPRLIPSQERPATAENAPTSLSPLINHPQQTASLAHASS